MDTSKLPLIENIVHPFNDDNDKETSQKRYELEGNCIKEHFSLYKSNVLVDLGAGIGQWSRLLAPQVKKVYAVELVDKLSEIGKKLTLEEGISNIEYIAQPAEAFCPPEKSVDRVLISGLLCLMDDKQCDQVATNVGRFLKCGGELFLRESMSIGGFPYLKPTGNNYPAIYRTPDMLINIFSNEGFVIKKCGRFFDGTPMDSGRMRLYYFVFTKIIEK
jgi:ubiquinone/menaquinone biosynthesis C-methylase UbiE